MLNVREKTLLKHIFVLIQQNTNLFLVFIIDFSDFYFLNVRRKNYFMTEQVNSALTEIHFCFTFDCVCIMRVFVSLSLTGLNVI